MAVDVVLLGLHHMHVIVGLVVDGAVVPQRAFLKVVAVVGAGHVVAGWLLVGVIHHDVILLPDGVVGKLLIAVGGHVYLEVRAVLEDVESMKDEIVRTKSLGGVGTLRTVHEHIEVGEVGTSHEGTVGHHHLKGSLVVYPFPVAVLEPYGAYALLSPCRIVCYSYRAVVPIGADVVVEGQHALLFRNGIVVHILYVHVVDAVNLAVFGSAREPTAKRASSGIHLSYQVGTLVVRIRVQLYGVVRFRHKLRCFQCLGDRIQP